MGYTTSAEAAKAVVRRITEEVQGNGNGGHEGKDYGTELQDDEKRALIEYLKTL